ncbi:30S ribosomal protein S1, partial [Arthrobacter sp. Hiyo6]
MLTKEDKEGRLILSKKRAQYERAWGDIEKVKEEDGVVTGTVIEVVKGGLILDIGLRGFLPASLVEMRRVRDLAPYIGQKIEAKIIELDKNRNNVVLSRRAWLEQTQSEVRSTFLNKLEKGQVRPGVVSSIVNFGAFVDLGGVDGLVHVSELSWKHIDHPSEVVEVGQEVTVEVLEVDLDRERVSLSLKATQEDPWQTFARTHALGQVVPGKVTKLVPFGAFVRVEDGIEGLVHISELAVRHVELAEQVVSVGDELFVKVIDIDLERRRISLSLKQANEGVDAESTEFDPALYGMAAEYDEEGNYKYPEASIRSPTSGLKATRRSAPPGSSSTLTPRPAGKPTRSRLPSTLPTTLQLQRPVRATPAPPATPPSRLQPSPTPVAARSLPTRLLHTAREADRQLIATSR